ncbi:galactokinase [Thalassomonas viridans]|uniref:Galactokinase n=1 Tax=Thalassomonas viridans TaxID=137584 RepID=A0AAE9ZA42_9GAMM|nr:galactokinase [Thalassomonas viridans]WDE08829.1 galactokinase [Thalassomonas viridans]
MKRSETLTDYFTEAFQARPELVCHAPGRVNLIGDHTDYNQGFVLPVAIDFGTDIAIKARDDRTIRVVAWDLGREQVRFSLDDIRFDQQAPWSNYLRGSLIALMETYPDIKGADLLVSGNVPQGAGLSSSASFEMAVLSAFAQINDLALDGVAAALKGQQAENDFVGCNCGIMDQLISAQGKRDHAMLLDCQSLSYQYAALPKELSLLIVNSNVKRGLVDSEYNLRREQCEAAAGFFGKSSLRELSLRELNQAETDLDPVLFKRARHVISENLRTEQMLSALNNRDMATMSRLMADSHLSLKEDFQVTTRETDLLVDILAKVLSGQGGARMTGGGFGGCVVALAPGHLVPEAIAAVLDQYQAATGLVPDIYQCRAVDGAFS